MKPAEDRRLQSIIVVVMKAGIDPGGDQPQTMNVIVMVIIIVIKT